MKRIGTILFTIFCFAALAAAQKVTYQYDRGMDFTKFHTYKWVTVDPNPQVSQITAGNIVNLINTQLAQKGLVLVTGDQEADLYVGFQASVTQSHELNWFNSGGMRWGGGMGSATTSTIDNGTLVVDFYNPAQKQLVWRGIAAKTLDPSSNPDKNYKNLQNTIAKVLKDFPPRVKN